MMKSLKDDPYSDGYCFDPNETRQCVACGTTASAFWRQDTNGNLFCSTCRVVPTKIRSNVGMIDDEAMQHNSTMETISLPTSYPSTHSGASVKVLPQLALTTSDRTQTMQRSVEPVR